MNAPSVLKPPNRPPRELVKSTSFLLKRLGFAIKDRTVDAFEERGANPYQHGILCSLSESRAETQAQIADALGYDRSWLVGLLDELEERGLIERRRDPSDRRRQAVSMTPEGKRALTKLRALHLRLENDFLADLDESQRARLHGLLRELARRHLPHCAFQQLSSPAADG